MVTIYLGLFGLLVFVLGMGLSCIWLRRHLTKMKEYSILFSGTVTGSDAQPKSGGRRLGRP